MSRSWCRVKPADEQILVPVHVTCPEVAPDGDIAAGGNAALGSNAGRAAQPPCQQGTGYGSGDAAPHENLVQPTPSRARHAWILRPLRDSHEPDRAGIGWRLVRICTEANDPFEKALLGHRLIIMPTRSI